MSQKGGHGISHALSIFAPQITPNGLKPKTNCSNGRCHFLSIVKICRCQWQLRGFVGMIKYLNMKSLKDFAETSRNRRDWLLSCGKSFEESRGACLLWWHGLTHTGDVEGQHEGQQGFFSHRAADRGSDHPDHCGHCHSQSGAIEGSCERSCRGVSPQEYHQLPGYLRQ